MPDPGPGIIPYAEEPINQPHWNYRVVKNEADACFSIRLIEYKEDGTVAFVHEGEDSYPLKDTPEDFAKDIRRYVNALNRPVLEMP